MRNKFLVALCFLNVFVINAQNKEIAHKKGNVFFFWGWNRAFYSSSNIHFKGDDYDFTLHGVTSHDHPIPFSYEDYINPGNITIPQNNYKIGYFFKDNWAISLGTDHMKYIIDQNQEVKTDGYINHPGYENVIHDGKAVTTEDFITFEHTDGLNYINAELEYYHNFIKYGVLKLNGLVGAGAGIMYPKTNAKLLDFERNDVFHFSGWGIDIKVGAELLFWNLFFLRTELKEGYINMPNIATTSSNNDSASQELLFLQWNYTFGFNWHF